MADIKAAAAADEEQAHQHHRFIVTEPLEEQEKKQPPHKSKRVASLDTFRGLTLMILVDDAGEEWPMIGHAPWNGCNLADFVMPFFLFIVGMSIALAFKRIPNHMIATKKVILRTLKLLFWGLLLQGGFSHDPDKLTYGVDMKKIRWCGILQRIALAYFVVALIEISTKTAQAKDLLPGRFSIFKLYCWHWLVGACVLIVYLALIYGVYVPDWHFTVNNRDSADYGKILTVNCGVRGKLDPPCNTVGYIDREVLGINHMYAHPAWKRSKSHASRLRHWVVMGLALLVLGITLHFTDAIPLNKQLYTFSYVCVTSGAAALVFSAFYVLVDIGNVKFMFLPLEWIGMNAMLVYVMAAEGIFAAFINGWYYDDPHNTLVWFMSLALFFSLLEHQFLEVVEILNIHLRTLGAAIEI
ncbi:hypothetical protein RHGRI_014482 [Rhododendron griersonianum]|uniref:Heparan-alpha-glucosaminide N-acetyltransferase catalytic domain-containing protein n=1 Tax=Rhododendron griersonianum TaxID=479676 RepID=A0AAV6K9I0_9ERIC|nr:hypothetical protein RHGRI_014482 [Rhododendron griersonianum]